MKCKHVLLWNIMVIIVSVVIVKKVDSFYINCSLHSRWLARWLARCSSGFLVWMMLFNWILVDRYSIFYQRFLMCQNI